MTRHPYAIGTMVIGLIYSTSSPANTDLGPGVVNATVLPYTAHASTSLCASPSEDTTSGIQNALNAVGGAGGGIVFLPTGVYCVRGALTIPSFTTLDGVFLAPARADDAGIGTAALLAQRGTVLYAYNSENNASGAPFITLGGYSATLNGLTIYYPNQTAPSAQPFNPKVFPPTVRGGVDTSIQDVMLLNSYDGIDFSTNDSARHRIRGVYGQPLKAGIRVNRSHDVGRISDVHFGQFWSKAPSVAQYIAQNGTAISFGSADFEVVDRVFASGYLIGLSFANLGDGAANGQFSSVTLEKMGVGIDVQATYSNGSVHPPIQMNNISIGLGGLPGVGIRHSAATAPSNLSVANAVFSGPNLQQAITWDAAGLLSVADSRFMQAGASLPIIHQAAGDVIVTGSSFPGASAGVTDFLSTSSAGRTVFASNILYSGSLTFGNTNVSQSNNQP